MGVAVVRFLRQAESTGARTATLWYEVAVGEQSPVTVGLAVSYSQLGLANLDPGTALERTREIAADVLKRRAQQNGLGDGGQIILLTRDELNRKSAQIM